MNAIRVPAWILIIVGATGAGWAIWSQDQAEVVNGWLFVALAGAAMTAFGLVLLVLEARDRRAQVRWAEAIARDRAAARDRLRRNSQGSWGGGGLNGSV